MAKFWNHLEELFRKSKKAQEADVKQHYEHLPKWFAGVAGLLYLTGFLIVSWHLGSLGIKEAGADPFRLRFIEVGILFNIPYVVVLMQIIAFKLLGERAKDMRRFYNIEKPEIKKSKIRQLYVKGMLICLGIFVYFSTFILLLYFAPHTFFKLHLSRVFAFAVISVISIVLSVSLAGRYDRKCKPVKAEDVEDEDKGEDKRTHRDDYVLRTDFEYFYKSMLICSVPLLSTLIFFILLLASIPGFWDIIPDAVKSWGTIFLFFLTLSEFLLFLLLSYIFSQDLYKWRGDLKACATVFIACIAATVYYYSIISFASNIYNHIPAHKGGGDYLSTPAATITFRENYDMYGNCSIVPSELLDVCNASKNISKAVYMVCDSPLSVYVTRVDMSRSATSRGGDVPPEIYQIRKDNISSIKFSARTQ